MFIRKTQNKKKIIGGQNYTHRLVESQRTGKESRQHTLVNPGVYFDLPKEQWPILTKRIQEGL